MAVTLDATDHAIIGALLDDARLSARAIGRRVGLSAGTVTQRITRLEAAGVIGGYRVVLDPSLVGRALGFVIGLQITQGTPLAGTLDELIQLPEIDEVFVVTGRWDLLVVGRVADPPALNRLLTERLWQSPSFRHSETMLVIDDRRSPRT